MLVHVLGSGAGGGFPQWNCNCHNCDRYRSGAFNGSARTQSSICVSGDGENWVLLNASPDIRSQLAAFPKMQPNRQLRDTAICGVVLIDAQIDHTAGLLILREGEPLNLYCTESVYEDLTTGFPVLTMLQHYCGVNHTPISLSNNTFKVKGCEELEFTAIPIKSKAPPYSPHRNNPKEDDNIALLIKDTKTQKQLFYAPGLGQIEPHLHPIFNDADCILVDGSFWSEDEMIQRGVGTKLAKDMGHLPQSGETGMVNTLNQYPNTRKVLIHINNTNPILDKSSHEYATLKKSNIEVAHDTLLIEL